MILASLFFAFLAAALHVFIFTMESVTWTRPATWKRFSIESQDHAEITRSLAYNQGFYNLFLAAGALTGIGLVVFGPAPRRTWPAGLWSFPAAGPCSWRPWSWPSAAASTSARPPPRA